MMDICRKKLYELYNYEKNSLGVNDFMKIYGEWLQKIISKRSDFLLYRYTSVNTILLDSIRRGVLHLSPNGSMNDCYEGIPGEDISKFYRECDIQNQMKELAYMRCFSETDNNMALWGNYADESKGVCIEYDLKKLSKENQKFIISHIYPVLYTEDRNWTAGIELSDLDKALSAFEAYNRMETSISKSDLEFFEAFRQVFLFKGKDWNYEKEWRLIFTINDIIDGVVPSSHELDFDCVTKISMGNRISKPDENEIKALADVKHIIVEKKEFSDWKFKYK